MKIFQICFVILNLNLGLSFLLPDISYSRRELLAGSLFAIKNKDYQPNNNQPIFTLSSTFSNLPEPENKDNLAHWSLFGLIPPPIETSITYSELVNRIQKKEIYTLQIAVQHNCIIATTKKGHRIACLIPDSLFTTLINDSFDKDGNLLVYILPIDPVRSKIRTIAQFIFITSLSIIIGADSGILPIDLPVYSSIKERNEYLSSGKKPKKLIKSLIDNLFRKNNIKLLPSNNITNTTIHS